MFLYIKVYHIIIIRLHRENKNYDIRNNTFILFDLLLWHENLFNKFVHRKLRVHTNMEILLFTVIYLKGFSYFFLKLICTIVTIRTSNSAFTLKSTTFRIFLATISRLLKETFLSIHSEPN